MKRFLLTLMLLGLTLPAFAGISIKESTSPQYLDNYGVSDAGIHYVQMFKAGVNGEPYYIPANDQQRKLYNGNKVWDKTVDLTRSFFDYLDPSLDADRFMKNDIKYHSNAQDF